MKQSVTLGVHAAKTCDLASAHSNLRVAHVIRATPAKRITFFKSGDSQFGGIRMAIHKRSFKCFDALLDDLSQKVPLPFGVRTVTTPRGTNTIRHLEQLQDGGCYLCSDRRHAKPINMELASKRPSIWHNHSRRPHRPESSSPPIHLPYRQRRILLVKNSEPGMRRSVVLSRRSTRSLRAFLDEVSEVMQFHVRKLYTAEGRRIDNVQSLLTCPGVLVCAGREAFSPMLVNFIKRSSEEKLPGLGNRTLALAPGFLVMGPDLLLLKQQDPRLTELSPGPVSTVRDMKARKMVINFGLETKKSIIHPRSDSSNRSTRFSLSSEKSYGNGVSAYSQGRPAIMNDDIEKRVLVNKDGSLSVEMKVRFRLHNDETCSGPRRLKNPPLCPMTVPEGVEYSSQPLHRALEANRCPCCYQRPEQQYDLWENPVHSHKKPLVPPPHPHTSSHTHTMVRHTHSSSSSSSCNSRRVVRCRAQLSSCGGGSGSEQSQLVQEEMCVTEQVERRVAVEQDGDTHVEVCRVSRCCSRSEVVSMDTNIRPLSSRSAEDELMIEDGDRPLSAVSSSSRVLQSLKEDHDDEDDDLPPSASQCCHSNAPSPSPTSQIHLNDKPSSNVSAASPNPASPLHEEENPTNGSNDDGSDDSAVSTQSNKSNLTNNGRSSAMSNVMEGRASSAMSTTSNLEHAEKEEERAPSAASATSHRSNRSHKSDCKSGGEERSPSAMSTKSNLSRKSHKSNCSGTAEAPDLSTREEAEGENTAERSTSSLSAKSGVSVKSHKSNCPADSPTDDTAVQDDNTNKRATSSLSVKSKSSAKSGRNPKEMAKKASPKAAEGAEEKDEVVEEETQQRPESAMSAKSEKEERAASASSCRSHKSTSNSNTERAASALSGKSASSAKSPRPETDEDGMAERTPSAMSGKSHSSSKSKKSGHAAASPNRHEERNESQDRAASAMSAKSKSSVRSSTSHKSASGKTLKSASPSPNVVTINTPEGVDEEGNETTERPPSTTSVKSGKSSVSNGAADTAVVETANADEKVAPRSKSPERTLGLMLSPKRTRSPRTHSPKTPAVSPSSPQPSAQQLLLGPDAGETRGPSALSVKSATSAKSGRSKCRCCTATALEKVKKDKEVEDQEGEKKEDNEELKSEEAPERAASVMSSSSQTQRKESGDTEQPLSRQSSGPCSKVETYSESTLSHSLSAADLLKETMAARPQSRQSKASKTSDKARSEKSTRCCQGIRNQREELSMTPACLPNASPNEVVSDWLRSIPANSSLLAFGDELIEGEQEMEEKGQEKPGEEAAKEEESPEDDKVDKEEKSEAEEGQEQEGEAECDATEEEMNSDPAPGDAVGTTSSRPSALLLTSESLPRNWHSSVAVMKVLLSSSLGRCRSMPEVSPVYGRRLSTSARGLLDCLAQLQLIEPAVSPGCDQKDRNQQYEDIMAILQSLWLTEPGDLEAKKGKDVDMEQVTPPRSSSGVDMSSGSGGSGKENGNQGGDETPPKESESLHEDEGAEKVVGEDEEGNAEGGEKETEAEPEEAPAEEAITEEQVQGEEQSEVPSGLDSPKATDNPSSSDKSSANDSSKSPTDNEQETVEDSSASTPPTVLRAPLSKRLSQDPDPVWVLHLLKKLEKQFINHYINAMAEFKVRWDLDDSLILDTMISELREEVSRRIQSSIEREMRKIQSRAGRVGRSPRPPQGRNLSRESTMTEKRRRMLKVMKNQSVKTADSLSDEEMTGEFSDQRSDDEYCPCDACVRKKMAARPLKTNPNAAEAPVMMEFDLLKILQLKKSPLPAPAAVPQSADVQKEDEEIEEEDELESGGEEEEEEEEACCQCHCARNEEGNEGEETGGTSDNTGEDETAYDEETEKEEEGDNVEGDEETGDNEDETGTGEDESDKETVKDETAAGEEDKTENGEEEEEEEEEEESDDAVKNEESTLMEGNVSVSAEDEDDGEDGTGEGGSHEDEKGGESEQQEGESSGEERASPPDQGATPVVSVTEGEEADAEDSDANNKCSGDTSAGESGCEGAGTAGEQEGGEGEEEVVEDAVEEFKPEEEDEEDGNKKENGALLHQHTRTSLESLPGSLEEINMNSQPNPVSSIEVPKKAAAVCTGGCATQKRSRSPARVKRRKPKESDVKLEKL
ncbi:hypothetical protein INR49_032390 [Caranx melampygus]|nr:hypothetical protein INR49_032390 [Caranx melampygus]